MMRVNIIHMRKEQKYKNIVQNHVLNQNHINPKNQNQRNQKVKRNLKNVRNLDQDQFPAQEHTVTTDILRDIIHKKVDLKRHPMIRKTVRPVVVISVNAHQIRPAGVCTKTRDIAMNSFLEYRFNGPLFGSTIS